MRRLLLMTAAASVIALTACMEVELGSSAHADETSERVRLIAAEDASDCLEAEPAVQTAERSADDITETRGRDARRCETALEG
ncbi:MAG: hypothetical protein ABL308_12120 [Oceanicaulis sp.]